MPETARPASSMRSKIPSRVRTPSGTGRSPTSISVAIPKQPSEPTNRPTRSYPGASRPRPPQAHHRPVGEHHGEPGHVPRRHAVLEAMRTARVLGHVAADRACRLGGGVGGVVEPVRPSRDRELRVDHPRLQHGAPVRGIDLEDPVHARGAYDDRAVQRHRTPRQARSGPPGHDGEAMPRDSAHDSPRLGCRSRQDDRAGTMAVGGEGVRLVDEQAVRVDDDGVTPHDLDERPGEGGRNHG